MKLALALSMFAFPTLSILGIEVPKIARRIVARRRARSAARREFAAITERERIAQALAETPRPRSIRHGSAGVGHAVRPAGPFWVAAGETGGAASNTTQPVGATTGRSSTSSGVFSAASTAGL